ncbi:MAG: hypothetical protein FD165_2451 [Gammaproteobacteria bacterium]|nr:MAG: hypothetical protein FD165_2451 [Gammaproteobacteria bacterium]TND03635.1 MAG: hypothetical protein FD120_1791 [Gammaproteobacteria bacterium]
MNRLRSQGFTLTELLVAVAIGLIVFAGVITFYVSTARTGTESLKIAKLNQYLRTTMDLMVSDIRRAGFWAAPSNQYRSNASGFLTNASIQPGNDIATGNRAGEPANSCITYTYDTNKNGTIGTGGSPLERFGFRLNSKKLEMRQSGTNSPFTCNNGTWNSMIDDIEVSSLVFTLNTSAYSNPYGELSTKDVRIRTVTITVTGNLKTDPAIARTLSETVRVRNDKFGT